MTTISRRQRASIYIYIYNRKKTKRVYIQKSRHFAKSSIIWITLLYTRSQTLYVTRFFMNVLRLALYTKSMIFCVTWRFYIQKDRHFAKGRQFALRLLYTKSLTLCVTQFFMGFLKFLVGRGHFYIKKQYTLCYIFIWKKNALSVTFLYTNS